MMVLPSINSSIGRNEDADLCLSELTKNSLMISNTQEITKFNTNVLTNPNKGGVYSNGLSMMTTNESSISSDLTVKVSPGPLGASSFLALPQADVGLLAGSFPDCWNDWESKRRSESKGHHEKFWKKHHTKQLRNLKRIRRKTIHVKKVKVPSIVSFRRRRFRDGCMKVPVVLPPVNEEGPEVIPFQSSKSLRRRQRRRVVRFKDEEITEWKREQPKGQCFGRGLSSNETPFMEAHRERKQSQRALMDLQVGMKCMGL